MQVPTGAGAMRRPNEPPKTIVPDVLNDPLDDPGNAPNELRPPRHPLRPLSSKGRGFWTVFLFAPQLFLPLKLELSSQLWVQFRRKIRDVRDPWGDISTTS